MNNGIKISCTIFKFILKKSLESLKRTYSNSIDIYNLKFPIGRVPILNRGIYGLYHQINASFTNHRNVNINVADYLIT